MIRIIRKIFQVMLAIVFVLVIILPVTFADFEGGKRLPSENRLSAKFPSAFSITDFEKWMKDNVFGRLIASQIRFEIDYSLFKTSPSPYVKVGKNPEWLYYTLNSNIEIGTGKYAITNDYLQSVVETQKIIQKELQKRGISYVLCFVPSKVSVYPEMLTGEGVGTTLIDVVTEYLRLNTTIPIINLKDKLMEEKKDNYLYLKMDSHWDDIGEYIAYKEVFRSLSELGLVKGKLANTILGEEISRRGDLINMMGGYDFPIGTEKTEMVDKLNIIAPFAIDVTSDQKNKELTDLFFYNKAVETKIYINNNVKDKKALIYGDSFFQINNMTQLLAENFSEEYFINNITVREDEIDAVKPDIVIFEMTERLLPYLPSCIDPSFIN